MEPGLILAAAVGVTYFLSHGRRRHIPEWNAEIQARYESVRYAIMLYSPPNPPWILSRIAFIESAFDVNAVGEYGELGMYQVTADLLADFNRINNLDVLFDELADPYISTRIASWAVSWHLEHYDGNLENAIKAYNTGRGGIHSRRAAEYWLMFQDSAVYFPELEQ